MRILFALSLLVVVGCYSEEPGMGVSYGYGAAPGMVYVGPGVQVISDYDYPVFYSDNYYWRYDGGLWYRSGVYNGGWSAAYDVPVGVRGIREPGGYVHYRGNAGFNGGGGYRGGGGPEVRDHRTGPAPAYRAPAQTNRPAGGGMARPVVRDHRR